MTPNHHDERLTAVGLLAEVYTALTARFAADVERHGVSLVEFEVLVRLARSPGRQLRMTDLAAQTSLSTSGVTRVVDRLDRERLVCRQACPTDRRSSYAVLTDTGQARLDAILPGHLALIDEWLISRLTPAQLDGMLDALRTLRDAVHPGATTNTLAARNPAAP